MVGAVPRKLDITKSTVVRAHVNQLWPVVRDVARWPEWFRARGGAGLQEVVALPHQPGVVHPETPEVGRRYRFLFTNGLAAEWQVTLWLEPAQLSLGMVKDTRAGGGAGGLGLEGMILDLDLFPQRDGSTQLWFGALLLLEKGFRPSFLARWPKREVAAWVDGFHAAVAAEARRSGLSTEAKTKDEVRATPAPRA